MAKSPVLLQRLPSVACIELGRGDGDGAGDTELLLGESECSEPLDWWIILVRLKIKSICVFGEGARELIEWTTDNNS